jgi:hypothetical protein
MLLPVNSTSPSSSITGPFLLLSTDVSAFPLYTFVGRDGPASAVTLTSRFTGTALGGGISLASPLAVRANGLPEAEEDPAWFEGFAADAGALGRAERLRVA